MKAPIEDPRTWGLYVITDRTQTSGRSLEEAVGANGVHLSQRGLPPVVARRLLGPTRLLGVSCHSLAEAEEAQQGGADFIVLGPIFYTPSKALYGPPVGLELIREVRPRIGLPIVAIGGITAANRSEGGTAGADGGAGLSAGMAAPDVSAAVRALRA